MALTLYHQSDVFLRPGCCVSRCVTYIGPTIFYSNILDDQHTVVVRKTRPWWHWKAVARPRIRYWHTKQNDTTTYKISNNQIMKIHHQFASNLKYVELFTSGYSVQDSVEFLRSKGKTLQVYSLSFLGCPWVHWDELIRNFWTPNRGNCITPKSIKIKCSFIWDLMADYLLIWQLFQNI